jgi:hypothetical protein
MSEPLAIPGVEHAILRLAVEVEKIGGPQRQLSRLLDLKRRLRPQSSFAGIPPAFKMGATNEGPGPSDHGVAGGAEKARGRLEGSGRLESPNSAVRARQGLPRSLPAGLGVARSRRASVAPAGCPARALSFDRCGDWLRPRQVGGFGPEQFIGPA